MVCHKYYKTWYFKIIIEISDFAIAINDTTKIIIIKILKQVIILIITSVCNAYACYMCNAFNI